MRAKQGENNIPGIIRSETMEAVPVLPQLLDSSQSPFLPAPLLPTCSFTVPIQTLHKTHTFLVCSDGGTSSSLRHQVLVTPWLEAPRPSPAHSSGHIFLRFLTTDMGFPAFCRSLLLWERVALCARWRAPPAAASKGWVPRKCPPPPSWGQTHVLTRSDYRTNS